MGRKRKVSEGTDEGWNTVDVRGLGEGGLNYTAQTFISFKSIGIRLSHCLNFAAGGLAAVEAHLMRPSTSKSDDADSLTSTSDQKHGTTLDANHMANPLAVS